MRDITKITLKQAKIEHEEDSIEEAKIFRHYSHFRRKPTLVRYSGQQRLSLAQKLAEVKEAAKPEDRQSIAMHDMMEKGRNLAEKDNRTGPAKSLAIYIDGPYGAPASNIFRAHHAVLIATGIGVTPFSSILQSIMHRY